MYIFVDPCSAVFLEVYSDAASQLDVVRSLVNDINKLLDSRKKSIIFLLLFLFQSVSSKVGIKTIHGWDLYVLVDHVSQLMVSSLCSFSIYLCKTYYFFCIS